MGRTTRTTTGLFVVAPQVLLGAGGLTVWVACVLMLLHFHLRPRAVAPPFLSALHPAVWDRFFT